MNSLKRISFALLIALLIHNGKLLSQNTSNSITGYVKDASTGQPLLGVNVFISGTYWGSTTNNDGYYEIVAVVPGTHEIVASMVGYEPKVEPIIVKENRRSSVDFYLKAKTYDLDEVEVEAEVPEEWYDQLELFKKYFLGTNDYAYDCTIENEYEMEFEEDDEFLKAFCDNSIIVINKALGFKIDCVLLDYKFNKETGGVQYIVKPRFTELKSTDPDIVKEWQENRREAFEGSLRHFLISLIRGAVIDEDFSLVSSIQRPSFGFHRGLDYSREIVNYVSSTQFERLIDNALKYDSTKAEYEFTIQRPWTIDYWGWISILNLPFGSVTLDEYGYPKQLLGLDVYGRWADYGVASMLPQYYELKFYNE